MNGDKCFVDTNILVYAHDQDAGQKCLRAQAVLEELWQSGRGVLSTQVLQEFAAYLVRHVPRPLKPIEARTIIADFLGWEIFINTPGTLLQALDTKERFNISIWDAMIVQAAENSGASTLYSEDLAHGQRYGRVQLINPFRDQKN